MAAVRSSRSARSAAWKRTSSACRTSSTSPGPGSTLRAGFLGGLQRAASGRGSWTVWPTAGWKSRSSSHEFSPLLSSRRRDSNQEEERKKVEERRAADRRMGVDRRTAERRAQADRRVRRAQGAGDRRVADRRIEDRRADERRDPKDRRNAASSALVGE